MSRLDRLNRLIDSAPREQSRLLAHATTEREQHEQRLADATTRQQEARDLLASLEQGPARWLRRGDLARAREQAKQAGEAYQVAQQAADRAADRERAARHEQQHHQAHQEAHPDLADRRHELLRVQAWRNRADARAVELLQPEWSRELGQPPATVKGSRTWDRAVERTIATANATTTTSAPRSWVVVRPLGRPRKRPWRRHSEPGRGWWNAGGLPQFADGGTALGGFTAEGDRARLPAWRELPASAGGRAVADPRGAWCWPVEGAAARQFPPVLVAGPPHQRDGWRWAATGSAPGRGVRCRCR